MEPAPPAAKVRVTVPPASATSTSSILSPDRGTATVSPVTISTLRSRSVPRLTGASLIGAMSMVKVWTRVAPSSSATAIRNRSLPAAFGSGR